MNPSLASSFKDIFGYKGVLSQSPFIQILFNHGVLSGLIFANSTKTPILFDVRFRPLHSKSIHFILEKFVKNTIMSAWWRAVGINYIKYSSISANVVRSVVKGPEAQKAAAARNGINIMIKKSPL